MRILHVITTLSQLGGAENHLLSLTREQNAQGHAVDIAWLIGDGELADRYRAVGTNRVFKASLDKPWQAFSAIATLRREISKQTYDVVHTHLMKSNAIGGIAARLASATPASISTKHCDDFYLKRPPIGWIHGAMSRLLDDHVICISDHVLQFVRRYGHVPENRSSRIYYGFDQRSYPVVEPVDVRTEFDLPSNAFVFGTIGRLTEQKNHLFLLPAFAKIVDVYPDARLLFVGSEGYSPEYRKRVEEKIAELDLGDKVILTGWLDDAYAIMAGLDCMLLASQWEGLGVVFIEAVNLGVPVISLRASAVPEVVRDGIDGFLVEPGDGEGLHAAMTRMIEDHDAIVARTSVEGPAHIARKFTVENMVGQTLDVYRAALDARGVPPREGPA